MGNNPLKPPFRDRIIPWYFVMAFAVIFIVNGIFVYMATSTHRGVVTKHSYNKGLNYNSDIKQAALQKSLGWNGVITLDGKLLSYQLKDKNSQPIKQADINAHIVRPTQDKVDFTVPLVHKAAGRYNTTIDFPMKGQWDITVVVKWNKQNHQTRKRVIIR